MKDETATNEEESLVIEPDNIKRMYLALFTPEDLSKTKFIQEVRVQIGLKLGPSEEGSDRELLIRLDAKQVAAVYRMLHDSLEAISEELKKLPDA